MKKLLCLVLAMLFGVSQSGCAMNGGTTENSSPPQSTPAGTVYSSDELNSVQNDVIKYFQSFSEDDYRKDKLCQVVQTITINDGYVEVYLTEINDDLIKQFKENVSDSDAIKLILGLPGHED